MRKLWERVTATMPVIGPDSTGILRIPRQIVSCLFRFVDANALLDGEDYPQIEGQFYRMLHGERGEHIGPSLAGSAAFMAALCDAAYMAPALSQRQSAHTLIDQIAVARGVERQRFELDSLPMCGLDGDICFVGACGHVYELTIGLMGRPLLRGRGGRMHTAAAHDLDPEQRQLLQRVKLLLHAKLRAQSRRLELAMLTGQRWDADLFAQMLAHPLLAHHARHLLWAGYDAAGNLIEGFLVQENGDLVAENYGPFDLARCFSVGIPHPADLSPERALAWAELLDDFQVLPLFPQLRRPLFAPLAGERRAVTRFAGIRITLSVFSALDALGWRAPLGSATATLELPGVPVQATLELRSERTGVTMEACTFSAGGRALRLEDVPSRFLSEAVWHLTKIAENPRLRAEA